jgi:lantibiotic modifying enzyme
MVLKSTNIYTQILASSYHPYLLVNKWHRKLFLMKIIYADDSNENIAKAEIKDMYNGDVPYFWWMKEC